MRRCVLSAAMSLDGYIARRDGTVDFLIKPKEFSMAGFMATVDTLIVGRKTLDAALRMTGGKLKMGMPAYVFSHTQPPGARDGVEFVDDSPERFMERLRKRPGKDIWLMGGGELVREFLKADLVDAVDVNIMPTLLGAGIPLFPGGFPQRDFELADSKTFAQGSAMLRYERARAKVRRKAVR